MSLINLYQPLTGYHAGRVVDAVKNKHILLFLELLGRIVTFTLLNIHLNRYVPQRIAWRTFRNIKSSIYSWYIFGNYDVRCNMGALGLTYALTFMIVVSIFNASNTSSTR